MPPAVLCGLIKFQVQRWSLLTFQWSHMKALIDKEQYQSAAGLYTGACHSPVLASAFNRAGFVVRIAFECLF